jgi:hypothetical protein
MDSITYKATKMADATTNVLQTEPSVLMVPSACCAHTGSWCMQEYKAVQKVAAEREGASLPKAPPAPQVSLMPASVKHQRCRLSVFVAVCIAGGPCPLRCVHLWLSASHAARSKGAHAAHSMLMQPTAC